MRWKVYLRVLLVVVATGIGAVLAVMGVALGYQEWGRHQPCLDMIVDAGAAAAYAAPFAPWWLLLVATLVGAAVAGWTAARVTRGLAQDPCESDGGAGERDSAESR